MCSKCPIYKSNPQRLDAAVNNLWCASTNRKCNRIIHANVYRASLVRMNVMINPFGTLTNPQPKKSKRNPTNKRDATSTIFLQQFYNKSQVVSCYWFKFETNTKITFLP